MSPSSSLMSMSGCSGGGRTPDRLAQQMDAPILTNDFNLNRVADLQGVKI